MLPQLAKPLALVLSLTALGPSFAQAQAETIFTPTDEILTTLRSRGYEILENERTWLGRQRILAIKDGTSREIVFIPATGEILRDYAMQTAKQPGQRVAGNDGTGADRASVGVTAMTSTTDATPSVSVGDVIGVTRDDGLGTAGDGSPP